MIIAFHPLPSGASRRIVLRGKRSTTSNTFSSSRDFLCVIPNSSIRKCFRRNRGQTTIIRLRKNSLRTTYHSSDNSLFKGLNNSHKNSINAKRGLTPISHDPYFPNSRQCLLGETLVLYYKCITAPSRQKPDN